MASLFLIFGFDNNLVGRLVTKQMTIALVMILFVKPRASLLYSYRISKLCGHVVFRGYVVASFCYQLSKQCIFFRKNGKKNTTSRGFFSQNHARRRRSKKQHFIQPTKIARVCSCLSHFSMQIFGEEKSCQREFISIAFHARAVHARPL